MTSVLKIKESGLSGRKYTSAGAQISGRQFAYDQDEIGNRISVNSSTNYTANNVNQYTAINSQNLTYDADGNMLSDGNWTYTWDGENRLTRMVSTNLTKTLAFTYDYQGRRIEKKVWNNTTGTGTPATYLKYIYDGMNLVADYDAINGRIIRSYTYGPGVDNIQSMTIYNEDDTTETYYYIKDLSNTVHALVNGNSEIVEYYYYDAFGNFKIMDDYYLWIPESVYGNRFLFQGREYDYDTALYYFRARWYEPETGRWLSPDPIGISGGLNLYVFCGNDPVNFIDPTGNGGVQFGDWFLGWGNPWLVFDASTIDELGKGSAATIDGFIPWFDPFKDVYTNECGEIEDKVYWDSYFCGSIAGFATEGALSLRSSIGSAFLFIGDEASRFYDTVKKHPKK